MSKSVIVAGGGIGGLASALALLRAGIGVRVFERAPGFAEIGAGMSLWPNATRVLKSWGVLDAVMACGREVTRFNLLRPDGSAISEIPMTGFATPGVCIHRADLHRALRAGLPDECLQASRTLAGFAQDEHGVTVHFADGSEAKADALVGADGINSVVRARFHGTEEPIYRGYCIWRGIAPDLGGGVRGHIGETWGAGRRFGILPMGRDQLCWYATLNGPATRISSPEECKAELRELFQDWHDPIPALIAATDPGTIMKNAARDRRPLRRWGNGRVTLLGDAAHPITPNVGQGACMAIEDAAALAKCLGANLSVGESFAAYEAMRKPRTAHVARQARRIGAIGQWENRWVVKGRNLVTRMVLSRSAEMQLNAIYGYKI
jgi:2-polyprenyl-6-methoxyphenol hydroxylase-like FAD-dependent oxidoreductase